MDLSLDEFGSESITQFAAPVLLPHYTYGRNDWRKEDRYKKTSNTIRKQ